MRKIEIKPNVNPTDLITLEAGDQIELRLTNDGIKIKHKDLLIGTLELDEPLTADEWKEYVEDFQYILNNKNYYIRLT